VPAGGHPGGAPTIAPGCGDPPGSNRNRRLQLGEHLSLDLNINRYEQLASTERQNIRELVRSCMADRGYRLRRDD